MHAKYKYTCKYTYNHNIDSPPEITTIQIHLKMLLEKSIGSPCRGGGGDYYGYDLLFVLCVCLQLCV